MAVASPVSITGMGLVCSIASSIQEFAQAIREGRCGISILPGTEGQAVRVGGAIRDFDLRTWLAELKMVDPDMHARARRVLNNTTSSTRFSVAAAVQAFQDARLGEIPGAADRLGVIVAGSNLSQDYIAENWMRYTKSGLANPRYAFSLIDSNQVGAISDILRTHGPGFTIGAASASGNAALFQAAHWIRSGVVERCLVVGGSLSLSALEREAFAVVGAASCGKWQTDTERACRPFDRDHDGFVFGEAAGCVILEAVDSPHAALPVIGEIVGVSTYLDGNHLPDPNVDGEALAMKMALDDAGLRTDQIGYLNSHGTSAPKGDHVECQAIRNVFGSSLDTLRVNSTKSMTGHCFSSAGVLELIATMLQLNGEFLHPNRNLHNPIEPAIRFAGSEAEPLDCEYALSNGFGFGGINTSIAVRRGGS